MRQSASNLTPLDALIVKGSFPPLMLAPVNFDALYEQAKLAKERDAATVQ